MPTYSRVLICGGGLTRMKTQDNTMAPKRYRQSLFQPKRLVSSLKSPLRLTRTYHTPARAVNSKNDRSCAANPTSASYNSASDQSKTWKRSENALTQNPIVRVRCVCDAVRPPPSPCS